MTTPTSSYQHDPFIKGMGSVWSLFPRKREYIIPDGRGFLQDQEQLRGDWQRVGRDMQKSVDRVWAEMNQQAVEPKERSSNDWLQIAFAAVLFVLCSTMLAVAFITSILDESAIVKAVFVFQCVLMEGFVGYHLFRLFHRLKSKK